MPASITFDNMLVILVEFIEPCRIDLASIGSEPSRKLLFSANPIKIKRVSPQSLRTAQLQSTGAD
jgi:hypothetical protein